MNSVSMAKTFSLIHFLQNFFNVLLSLNNIYIIHFLLTCYNDVDYVFLNVLILMKRFNYVDF